MTAPGKSSSKTKREASTSISTRYYVKLGVRTETELYFPNGDFIPNSKLHLGDI